MTSTALEPVTAQTVSIFPGATPDAVIAAATDAATRFSDVVRKQKMTTRINNNDHVQIEAWQTIGALSGVYASRGVVTELPWPTLALWVDEDPEPPGHEPRNTDTPEWRAWKQATKQWDAWSLHRDLERARRHRAHAQGRIPRHRDEEGRGRRAELLPVRGCRESPLRTSRSGRWPRPAHSPARSAPRSSSQETRYYETTSAEQPRCARPPRHPAGRYCACASLPMDTKELEAAVKIVEGIAPEIDAAKFMLDMGMHFDGVPEANLKLLRALWRRIGEARTPRDEPVAEAEVVA